MSRRPVRNALALLGMLAGCASSSVEFAQRLRTWPMHVPPRDEAGPETPTPFCGPIYWCCMDIRCDDGYVFQPTDVFVCPGTLGRDRTRAGAWDWWKHEVKATVLELDVTHKGVCWARGESCYDEPHGKPCGKYPN